MNTALSLLIVALMGVQSDGKKKEKDPVPEFQGTVKFVVYHEIVTEEELPDGQKSKTKTTVKRVQEALKDLKGLSNLKHIEGTRRFTVEMKGLYSDVDWIRIVLKHAKILSEIISPARIVLQPKGKPRNYAALIRKVKAVPGVGAVGKGRGWGVADPTVGIINSGAVLDVRPTVSADRKYVWLTTTTTNSKLQALLRIAINPVIAFGDLDKVSLRELKNAMVLQTSVPSHKELTFTFEEVGAKS